MTVFGKFFERLVEIFHFLASCLLKRDITMLFVLVVNKQGFIMNNF